MSKRANPFIEDYIPQSKVHVGMKQFNNNNDRLKKVYEKTLDLLFKGAKKIVEVNNETSCDISTIKRDNMKQLFIGKDGTLSHSGQMMSNKSDEGTRNCKCGEQGECRCAYCESTLCVSCLHPCVKCEAVYCTHCILIGYFFSHGHLFLWFACEEAEQAEHPIQAKRTERAERAQQVKQVERAEYNYKGPI